MRQIIQGLRRFEDFVGRTAMLFTKAFKMLGTRSRPDVTAPHHKQIMAVSIELPAPTQAMCKGGLCRASCSGFTFTWSEERDCRAVL